MLQRQINNSQAQKEAAGRRLGGDKCHTCYKTALIHTVTLLFPIPLQAIKRSSALAIGLSSLMSVREPTETFEGGFISQSGSENLFVTQPYQAVYVTNALACLPRDHPVQIARGYVPLPFYMTIKTNTCAMTACMINL